MQCAPLTWMLWELKKINTQSRTLTKSIRRWTLSRSRDRISGGEKKRNRFFLCCCMFVFDVGDRFSSSIAERRWWSVWIQAYKMPTDGGEEIGDEDYNSIIVYVIKQLAHTDLHSIIRFLHLFPSLFLTTLFSFIFFFIFSPGSYLIDIY